MSNYAHSFEFNKKLYKYKFLEYLYHGTTTAKVFYIRNNGLNPRADKNYKRVSKKLVYLTFSPIEAIKWSKMSKLYHDYEKKNYRNTEILLRIKFDYFIENFKQAIENDPFEIGNILTICSKQTIPASHIEILIGNTWKKITSRIKKDILQLEYQTVQKTIPSYYPELLKMVCTYNQSIYKQMLSDISYLRFSKVRSTEIEKLLNKYLESFKQKELQEIRVKEFTIMESELPRLIENIW